MSKTNLFSRMAALFGGNQSEAKNTIEEEEKLNMKIAIVSGSVREGNNAIKVSEWVYDFATKRNDEGVEYEIVDLADYQLALLGSQIPAEYQDTANATAKSFTTSS